MESLGGSSFWGDRVLARATALIYYWIIILVYMVSSKSAYHFMELVEGHAYASYDKFLNAEAEALKQQPAPDVALQYYRDGDLYMFDEFQTAHTAASRRPVIDNLYDVFVAIRDDEMEHVKTMVACQQPMAEQLLLSPHEMPTISTLASEPPVSASVTELNPSN